LKKLRLTEIWVYPIKSLGGIRVQSAKVCQKGLAFDRRWMLVDELGKFMTQRADPALALFKLHMDDHFLHVSFQHDRISIPKFLTSATTTIQATVWDDTVTTTEVDASVSAWFSAKVGKHCKLVAFPEQNSRPVDTNYQRNNEHVSLADGFPYLIIGQASLDDLNAKLEKPLPINRFRPNFVFVGGEAYEEDQWTNFKIGKNAFVGVKPCARCVLTTIDQETGLKGVEPLATLAKYRKKENKIYFGQNVLAIDHNEIYEGDEITF
jgi:uncharacterized protein YcbX